MTSTECQNIIESADDEDLDLESSHFESKKFPQIIASLSVTIGAFTAGLVVGWSSPAIPNLELRQDFGELSKQDKSWIGAISNLGGVFAFVAGILIECIGRKRSIIFLAVPSLVGWALLAASQNLQMMLVARFITGFAAGSFLLVIPVYISEIAESSYRGTLGTISNMFIGVGILFMYVGGVYLSWIWLSIISGVFPLLLALSVFFIPETPVFLLKKGRVSQAAESLRWLRGAHSTTQIEPELKNLQKNLLENMSEPSGCRELFTPSIFKPLTISMTLMFLQQFGGINAVLFFSLTIFRDSGSSIDPNLSSILLAILQICVVALSAVLIDRVGRRVLCVVSEIGMGITLSALGLFFYLKLQGGDKVPEGLGWLPLTSLLLYIFSYNLFIGAGPWLMMSELLPGRVKGLATAVTTSFCMLLGFIVTKSFEDLSSLIYPYGCYWLFAIVSFSGAIFGIFILPETKGKTLDEIQRMFT